jgi:hypothetical protein
MPGKGLTARDAYLRRNYGLTEAEWDDMLASQGGGCAGCSRQGVTRSLHTDHSHVSKRVRGILCASCNSALRKMKDNPLIAYRLGDYLTMPPASVLGYDREVKFTPKRRRGRKRVRRASP